MEGTANNKLERCGSCVDPGYKYTHVFALGMEPGEMQFLRVLMHSKSYKTDL